MLATFKKMFGSFAAAHINKQNDFSNLQSYFLQKASEIIKSILFSVFCGKNKIKFSCFRLRNQEIPVAMAKLRNSHGVCPPEVLKFLLDLFKYNDNSKNNFSDNYYRAAMVCH